jgi:hypothetical protein
VTHTPVTHTPARLLPRLPALLLALLLGGCATTGATAVPWQGPVPDYAPPPAPEVAPDTPGACAPGEEVVLQTGESAPCVGILTNPSDYQYLLDVEAQAPPVRTLLDGCSQEVPACRAWADQHYARVVAERDKAKRQRWEAFAVGGAVGGGVVGGFVLAIILGGL